MKTDATIAPASAPLREVIPVIEITTSDTRNIVTFNVRLDENGDIIDRTPLEDRAPVRAAHAVEELEEDKGDKATVPPLPIDTTREMVGAARAAPALGPSVHDEPTQHTFAGLPPSHPDVTHAIAPDVPMPKVSQVQPESRQPATDTIPQEAATPAVSDGIRIPAVVERPSASPIIREVLTLSEVQDPRIAPLELPEIIVKERKWSSFRHDQKATLNPDHVRRIAEAAQGGVTATVRQLLMDNPKLNKINFTPEAQQVLNFDQAQQRLHEALVQCCGRVREDSVNKKSGNRHFKFDNPNEHGKVR